MEKTIEILKKMREKHEKSFIEDSLIIHNNTNIDVPLPDIKANLQMIVELNQAISILENKTMSKCVVFPPIDPGSLWKIKKDTNE